MKKVAVIDNYDSFTFNLVHYLEDLGCEVAVFRNDEFEMEELAPFDKIILSPGPGIPDEAGLLKDVIRAFSNHKSILGVCLGQQAINEVFGGTLSNLKKVHHGVSRKIFITAKDEKLFRGLDSQLNVARYHSWIVTAATLPETLEATSVDEDGNIMSLRHKTLDIRGVQFHPESVLTAHGKQMLSNWVNG